MAEVLITLGIIGVVAAITLPTLISSFQKKVLSTRLKKEISFIQNSFRRLVADEGVSDFASSSVITVSPGVSKDTRIYHIDSEKFTNYLKLTKYKFVIPSDEELDKMSDTQIENLEKKYLNSFSTFLPENAEGYMLPDGACIAFTTNATVGSDVIVQDLIMIDVNCDQKPNTIGLDRFAFIPSFYNPERFYSIEEIKTLVGPDYYEEYRKECLKPSKIGETYEPNDSRILIHAMSCGLVVNRDGYEIKY